MRIAFVSYLYPRENLVGGGAMYAYNLSNALAMQGHKVDAIVPAGSWRLVSGANYVTVGSNKSGAPRQRITFLRFCSIVRELMNPDDYDVIHSNAGPAAILKRADIETLHHIEQPALTTAFFSNLVNIYSASRAKAVITVSHSTYAKLARLGMTGRKIFVTYSGVDCEKFYPTDQRKSSGVRTLLYVGHLIPRKNPILALYCLKAAKRLYPSRLIVVGRGYLKESFIATASGLGVANDVEFLEHEQEQGSLRSLYNAADVLVHPSLNEGFGMVLAESVACGTPFVAMNTGIAPELAEAGFGTVCRSSSEFVRGCLQILEGNARGGTKGHDYIERRFSWAGVAHRTLGAYSWCLKRGNN